MGGASVSGPLGVVGGAGSGAIRAGQSLREKAGHLAVVPGGKPGRTLKAFDAVGFQRDFPELWRDFLRQNFRGPVHVAHDFGVSERAARKWWDGIGGPRGAAVAQAVMQHPEAAAMLFAA